MSWLKPGAPVRLDIDGDVVLGHITTAIEQSLGGLTHYHVTCRKGMRVFWVWATLDEIQPVLETTT